MMTEGSALSIKALEGYFAVIRIFVMFIKKYPKLKEKIDDTVSGFISSEQNQLKRVVCRYKLRMC